ncbi:MAG: indolepyruvate ferredoxin oxidoreductase family protein [Sphingomonadaceae bacterium]
MTKSVISLDDKYYQTGGRVYLSAIQALVRLPIDQARRDRARGIKTAGFISGYRGSPLGTYDNALWGASKLLKEHDIRFNPGLNEELAASSVRGTQELEWHGKSDFEGVFGLWYGKGLGTDRGLESLKLGNLEGSSPKGGVLVVSGDDHGGKSSVSAHQSEHTLIAAIIPILYPAGAAEILEYGLLGWEMSRFTGLYTALKCVTDLLDYSASIELPSIDRDFIRPKGLALPPEGLGLRLMRGVAAQEEWAVNRRLPTVPLFARANGLDRKIFDSQRRELTLVSAGKAYLDLRQALDDLGLDEARCADLGIRLYKLGLIWPIDGESGSTFCAGSREVMVVEEKRSVIEDQLARALFNLPDELRPVIGGKRAPDGSALISPIGELSPASVRTAVMSRLRALGLTDETIEQRAAYFDNNIARTKEIGGSARFRPPYFCSGCPHNSSTRIPEGSMALSGTGCHALAAFMPERRTLLPMPMGGEGMPWVAIGPMVDTPHMFQNIGDGTYAHSGILAIRAAVAGKANMTYKILFNDAVAMTGGQPVEGQQTPVQIAAQLLAEGVSPVVMVTDQPEDFTGSNKAPAGVRVLHRDYLDDVQRELREIKGVSGLIYVQTCAAEKRRRRKRGTYPDPNRRVFINSAVCEGCGDCSVQSNCLSVQPLETEFGRKRQIDQSSCNKDFSCLKGFCPSFVTVEDGMIQARAPDADGDWDSLLATIPAPAAYRGDGEWKILVAGIGGTGVLTVGALIGMAAHLEGKGCQVMDMTGLAQKGGAVTSHIAIADDPSRLFSPRFNVASADLLLGCDMIVTAGADVLKTIKPGKTAAIVNADVAPTGEFQTNGDMAAEEDRLKSKIDEALGGGDLIALHASTLATRLTGDSIATNLLMMGYALQKGLLPLSVASIEEAIKLNGTAVKGNLRTLGLGRLLAEKPALFETLVAGVDQPMVPTTVEGILVSRIALLTAYQDIHYADRYRRFVEDIRARMNRGSADQSESFARAVALTLGRLMAYKDEYEVARLHADPSFKQNLSDLFGSQAKLNFHLAPPLLARTDPKTGRPRKIRFGGWMMQMFGVLRRFKALRGTPLDPFGYTLERREERVLITDYEALILSIVDRIDGANLGAAIELAEAAGMVRGYGPVKHANLERYRGQLPTLLAAFDRPAVTSEPIPVPALS